MGNRLQGKVAIVTGSGRGIGRGEALALASEGAKVVVNDLGGALNGTGSSNSPADDVVKEIVGGGGQAVANYDSVATWKGAENIIKTALDAFGRLDILVNNAGILRDRMIFNMSEEEWDAVIRVHLYGHFFTMRHACVIFRQQKSGRIINTSSIGGLGLSFGQANYSAAKEGIVGMTRQVAYEMARYGVTINAIRPSAGTRMTISEEMKAAYIKAGQQNMIEEAEKMKPEDIGKLVAWLASDDAANVNGRTFFVTTGQISIYSEPVPQKTIINPAGWTIDELFKYMPSTLAAGLANPAGATASR